VRISSLNQFCAGTWISFDLLRMIHHASDSTAPDLVRACEAMVSRLVLYDDGGAARMQRYRTI
jgi:hypothetical protein